MQRLSGGRFGGGGGKSGGGARIPPILFIVLGLGGGYYLFHLERVPQTGRWRFIDCSPATERQMGLDTYKQTLQEYRGKVLPAHHPQSKMVKRVADRIVASLEESGMHSEHANVNGSRDGTRHGSGHEDQAFLNSTRKSGASADAWSVAPGQQTDWEVFVIKDDQQKNAFVLPGGKIFVFTGILPIAKDENGLATVLGHGGWQCIARISGSRNSADACPTHPEIAHQLARHSAEKVSGFKVLMFGSFLLEMLGLDIGLSRTAVTLLLSLPNSRKTETEADYIGLQLMARACFDPSEAPHLWERMQSSEGGGKAGGGIGDAVQSVLSTHPVNSARIKSLRKWLPAAQQIREASNCPAPGMLSAFSESALGKGRRSSSGGGPGYGQQQQGQGQEQAGDPYGINVLRR